MNIFTPKNIDNDLFILINQTKTRIQTIEHMFNLEQNPILINSYIYELQALETRYSYYLSLVKTDSVKDFSASSL